ncbi:hypothetical protein CEP54_011951 [Fusarium duplospermum]|uniref:Uncharacterized protein n=1 Tax=Fusarium duplospermum TaxID=1325734 RepID=A0A428PBJ7_9HYPO|nr:hypothetical protein CEP54_011951 [Fusarium duplospermum]
MSGALAGFFFNHKIEHTWIYDQKVLNEALTKIYGSDFMFTREAVFLVVSTTRRDPENLKQRLVNDGAIRDPSCPCDNCQRMIEALKPKKGDEVTEERAEGSDNQ